MKKIINKILYCVYILSLVGNVLLLYNNHTIAKDLKNYKQEISACSLELEAEKISKQKISGELENSNQKIIEITNELNSCETKLKN